MLDVWIKAALELMGLDATWIKTEHDRCVPLIKELLKKEDLAKGMRQDIYQELAAISSTDDGTVDPNFFFNWLRNRVAMEKVQ